MKMNLHGTWNGTSHWAVLVSDLFGSSRQSAKNSAESQAPDAVTRSWRSRCEPAGSTSLLFEINLTNQCSLSFSMLVISWSIYHNYHISLSYLIPMVSIYSIIHSHISYIFYTRGGSGTRKHHWVNPQLCAVMYVQFISTWGYPVWSFVIPLFWTTPMSIRDLPWQNMVLCQMKLVNIEVCAKALHNTPFDLGLYARERIICCFLILLWNVHLRHPSCLVAKTSTCVSLGCRPRP